MSRSIRARAAVILAVLVLSGCQSTASAGQSLDGTSITFSVNVDDSERPAVQELISRFQHRTGTSVNLKQLSRFRKPRGPRVELLTDATADDMISRLRADAKAGGPTIHLFAQDNEALSPLVEESLVTDLTHLVDVPEEANRNPDLDGHFLPFRPNVRLAYARKSDLEALRIQSPVTLSELESTARTLKGDGRPRVTMSLARGKPTAVTLSELIKTHGGDPVIINDAGSITAFTVLQRLWRDGLLSPASFDAKYDTEVENLASGTVSLAENWSFTSAQLAKRGQLNRFSVSPGWNGPEGIHVIGGDVLAIPHGVKGKQLKAAVALATFLMSRESQELLARRNSWPSFYKDISRSVPADQQDTFKAIETALAHGWYRPTVPYWPQVSDQMNKAVNAILLEGKPVQPVLDDAHRAIRVWSEGSGVSYP